MGIKENQNHQAVNTEYKVPHDELHETIVLSKIIKGKFVAFSRLPHGGSKLSRIMNRHDDVNIYFELDWCHISQY